MDLIAEISHYGFWFIAVLTVLVFVHEMGHFAVARWCGVRVEVFSIGFGPELLGYTDRSGTRWKLSWLPLGGYVKMFGQEDNAIEGEAAKPVSEADRSVSFREKSVGRRAAIVVAGPAANYLFAIVALAAIYMIVGKPQIAPVIGQVIQDSPASDAGLLAGDRVVRLDGVEIDDFGDITYVVQGSLGQRLTMELERGGAAVTVELEPREIREMDESGKVQSFIGLGMRSAAPSEVKKLGIGAATAMAGTEVYRVTTGILSGIWQMVTGVRSSDEIGGVLRIAKMSGDTADYGWESLSMLAVLLSINLGLINLFPIPLLDGGHLAFYAAEAVRGRPLNVRAQEWGLKIGLALVLSLMLFATWNDLVYLKVFDYIRALFT